jgi:hypothetical protein
MNRIEELFEAIESQEFAAVVNLASDLRTFLRILSSEKAVEALAARMGEPGAGASVSQRITFLTHDTGNEGQEHPWDPALATYLWLLGKTDPALAKAAAEKIAGTPRCWWAAKLAQSILSPGTDSPPAPAVPPSSPAPDGRGVEARSR